MGVSSALGSSALLPAGLGFRNLLINGDMNIWQRGTSVPIGTLGYTADRWYHQSYNGAVISRQPTNDLTRLPTTRYCSRVLRNSGVTAVNFMYFTQSMETAQSVKLAGQTATLSFWARAGAGMTSTTFTATIFYGTGIDQNLIAGYTGQATAFTRNVTLTTTWQKFVLTGNVPTTATEVAFVCGYTPVGTAPANDYFEITNVQLEANVQPTPFEHRPIGVELALCQRYYEKSYDLGTAPATVTETGVHRHSGSGNASGRHYVPIRFKVEKRANDYTVTTYDPTTAGSSWITQNPSQAGIGRTPLVENKGTSGMVLNVEDGGYSWTVGNTRGHWSVSSEL